MTYHFSVVEIIHEINQQGYASISETSYTRNKYSSMIGTLIVIPNYTNFQMPIIRQDRD